MNTPSHLAAAAAAAAWQRLRPEALPGIFYAYDTEQRQTERVVTYELERDRCAALLARHREFRSGENEKAPRLTVHLGYQPRYNDPDQVPDYPAFTLFAQLHRGVVNTHDLSGSQELTWNANSRFTDISATLVTSQANAIPAASAYLFVRSWQELPEEQLTDPFTAKTRVLGERVKCYTFSAAETATILDDLRHALEVEDDGGGLAVHLGDGIAIWSHPFSFRPVVEVKGGLKDRDDASGSRRTTGASNDDGDSFFDYAEPNPPPPIGGN